jgi:hypothetical protein
LAIASKLELQLIHVQPCTIHDRAWRVMLQASLLRKTIHKLHGVQHHADTHDSGNALKWQRMTDPTSLLFQKTYITFDQTNIFQHSGQISNWIGLE